MVKKEEDREYNGRFRLLDRGKQQEGKGAEKETNEMDSSILLCQLSVSGGERKKERESERKDKRDSKL